MKKQQFLGASLHTGLFCTANGFDKVHQLIGIFEDECRLSNSKEGYFSPYTKNVTPIARPLSDLTKPITHNGETFVPISKLFKMPDSEVDIVSASEECVQFINKRTRCHYSFYVATIRLTEALELIEWHFNLMDESEPFIPVTDEFNPYK